MVVQTGGRGTSGRRWIQIDRARSPEGRDQVMNMPTIRAARTQQVALLESTKSPGRVGGRDIEQRRGLVARQTRSRMPGQ